MASDVPGINARSFGARALVRKESVDGRVAARDSPDNSSIPPSCSRTLYALLPLTHSLLPLLSIRPLCASTSRQEVVHGAFDRTPEFILYCARRVGAVFAAVRRRILEYANRCNAMISVHAQTDDRWEITFIRRSRYRK